jgi:hypothetical protein
MSLGKNTLPDNNAAKNAAGSAGTDMDAWEATLPEVIRNDIAAYLQGEKDGVLHLDCLHNELYGSINAHFWAGGMTEKQADYLRKKYLFGVEEDEDDDN